MNADELRYLALDAGTTLRIIVEREIEQDGGPVLEYGGPRAVLTLHAYQLSVLTPEGSHLVRLPVGAIAAARAIAIQPQAPWRARVDTSNLRLVTRLIVEVDDAFNDHGPAQHFALNHTMPTPWPTATSTLLCMVRDFIGACPAHIALPDYRREAIRLPHLVTAFVHDGPLYLRVGQGNGSPLYHLDDGTLVDMQSRTAVPRWTDHLPREPMTPTLGNLGLARWRLPCGGGEIIQRSAPYWGPSPQLVVRANDLRGIYIERG